MTRTAFIKEIGYLKDCKGLEGTSFAHLGHSVYDKIANIAGNERNIVTHFHIPKGDPASAEKLAADHLNLFDAPIDAEMLSFYTCFDGFEFRYVNLDAIWKSFREDDIFDWDEAGFDPAGVRLDDLKKDEFEYVLDDFQGMYVRTGGNLFEPDFDFGRLSDPKKTGIRFYGDSVEYEDYGIKSHIPPAAFLLDEGNRIYGHDALYFLNFHHSFRQLAFGKTGSRLSLFRADDAGADVKDLREDFRTHFKKQLIREE